MRRHPWLLGGAFSLFLWGGLSAGSYADSSESPSPDLPDYVKNWEFGIDIGEERTPLYFADLIFPLYRPDAEDRAVFLEPRVSHKSGETLFNIGTGYRHLVKDRSWMLGANLFYDYETHVSHQRLGAGLEALGSHAEARINGYLGLSRAREISASDATVLVERAVDGYDAEVGFPIPYYSRLKLFGGYEWYDFKKFKNREGWSVRVEYKPIPILVLDAILSDHTKKNTSWGIRAAFRLPLGENVPRRLESPLKRDGAMFPEGDAGDRLLSLVERHHEIVVESYVEKEGQLSIEIRRGT